MSARLEERRIGELVGGKYRVVRFLAAGGMGMVYEAQHTLVKRRFAVKFLRPDLAEKRESLARFQREAQTAGALESENLVAAVDFGIASDGSPFIVMEYLVGESVEALLDRNGPLPLERASDLVQQACRGIQSAHAANIVHRDLKPQNLFLCRREDGTDLVKVLDFGIAKLEAVDRNVAATETGAVLGTPAYMSPEQARGERSIDHRADVYALGAILYELLSGRKPHPGDSHNAILHHIATQPAVPLDFVEPKLPSALVGVIERALSSDPAMRFASAELLGQEISQWVERKVWPAPERTASSPTNEASDPTELAPNAAERAHAPTVELAHSHDGDVAPRGAPKALLVALGLAVALGGAWLVTRSSDETSRLSPADPPLPAAPRPEPVINAAEAPLPVATTAAPVPARSFETARERPLATASASRIPTAPATTRAPVAKTPPVPSTRATRHETEKSTPPLAFDRQNPYD